jgi:hypothetical protein
MDSMCGGLRQGLACIYLQSHQMFCQIHVVGRCTTGIISFYKRVVIPVYTFFVFFLLFFNFSPTKKQNYHHTTVRQGLYILRDRSRGSSKLLDAS